MRPWTLRRIATRTLGNPRRIPVGFVRRPTRSTTTPVGPDLLDGLLGPLEGLRLLGRGSARAGEGVLELPHPLTQRAAGLRQSLRAQDHEGDDEDDDELGGSDVGHGCLRWSGDGGTVTAPGGAGAQLIAEPREQE